MWDRDGEEEAEMASLRLALAEARSALMEIAEILVVVDPESSDGSPHRKIVNGDYSLVIQAATNAYKEIVKAQHG